MSFEPDNISEDLEIRDLLANILREMRLLNAFMREMTGFDMNVEDAE